MLLTQIMHNYLTWLLRSPLARAPYVVLFDLKPLIEDGNLQVYMYCVHARKRASGAPRTHFRACKISKFPGACPRPPDTIHFVGPHFLSLPWASPILSAALPTMLRIWGPDYREWRETEEAVFHPSAMMNWYFFCCFSNSEMSTKMYPRMCLRMVNRWERGWFPAKVIRYWHMGAVHCNAYSVWFLWSALVTQLPKWGLLYIAKKSNFVLSAAAVWSHGHMQLATNVSSTNWSSYIAALQNGHTTASDPLVWEWC